MRKTIFIASAVVMTAIVVLAQNVSSFTDNRDGQVYKTVKIGKQVWMAENLNYAAKGSVCYENKTDNCNKYGRLYNWETAMKACPAGYHLSTNEEWNTLVEYVGGDSTAGTKLKSTSGWKDNGNGSNEYAFSALPGGNGNSDGSFNGVGSNGHWLHAGEIYVLNAFDAHYASNLYMYYNYESVFRGIHGKTRSLFSVRCVRD